MLARWRQGSAVRSRVAPARRARPDFGGGARRRHSDPLRAYAAAFVRRICARKTRHTDARDRPRGGAALAAMTRRQRQTSSGALPTTHTTFFFCNTCSAATHSPDHGDDAYDSRAAHTRHMLCRDRELRRSDLGDDSEGYRENTRETLAGRRARRCGTRDARARRRGAGRTSSARQVVRGVYGAVAAQSTQSGNTAFSFQVALPARNESRKPKAGGMGGGRRARRHRGDHVHGPVDAAYKASDASHRTAAIPHTRAGA